MGEFATLAKLVVKWSRRINPIVVLGVIGAEVEISGECEINAATAAALTAAMAAAETALRVVDTDVAVWELGTKTTELTAASCIEKGPYMSVTWLEQTVALTRVFAFKAAGKTIGTADSNETTSSPLSTAYTTIGTRVVRQNGSIVGGTTSAGYASILAAWLLAYPWPNWVVTSEKKISSAGASIEYMLSAVEMADPLPWVGSNEAVEGTRSVATETDVNCGRQTITINYDLLVDGNMAALSTYLVPTLVVGEMFIRESITYGTISERRLQCSWQILRGINASRLLDWQHDWQIIGEAETHQSLRVVSTTPNAAPVLVYDSKREYRYQQSGRAVCLGAWMKPPYPMFPAALAKPVEVTLRQAGDVERETTWRYEFVSSTPLVLVGTELNRPATPVMWTGGATIGGVV